MKTKKIKLKKISCYVIKSLFLLSIILINSCNSKSDGSMTEEEFRNYCEENGYNYNNNESKPISASNNDDTNHSSKTDTLYYNNSDDPFAGIRPHPTSPTDIKANAPQYIKLKKK